MFWIVWTPSRVVYYKTFCLIGIYCSFLHACLSLSCLGDHFVLPASVHYILFLFCSSSSPRPFPTPSAYFPDVIAATHPAYL